MMIVPFDAESRSNCIQHFDPFMDYFRPGPIPGDYCNVI